MRKSLLLVLCLLAGFGALKAQTTVTGVVTSADDGTPMSFVSVLVKGTSTIAQTNEDGSYRITIPSGGKTLEFSFMGMQTHEEEIAGRSIINVLMQSDANLLEEAIVTGYGTFKKSAYAGSASVVKTERLNDVPAATFTGMLQGAAPGVQITSTSGQPGAATDIRIRGLGSINASKSPLYVIDGVPVISGDIGNLSSSSTTAGTDVMSTLSNSDIESIAVLKDAAASSLYGSRAANGVILITTKSGKKGKPMFNLKADMGFSDLAMDYHEVMSGQQRRDLMLQGLYNEAILKGKTAADATAYANASIDEYAPIPWCGFVDWNDVLFQKGAYQNYEASVSGGGDNLRYYSSLGYLNQDGATINSGLERITGRVTVDYNANKKLSLGAKVLFSVVDQNIYSEGTSYTSPFYSSRNAVIPSDPVYLPDGSYNRDFIRNGKRNPKLSMDYNFKTQAITRTFNTLYAQYEFIKNLRFKSTFSYDYTINKGQSWDDPRTSDGESNNGSFTKVFNEYKKLLWSNALSYTTTIGHNHHLDGLVAYDIETYDSDFLNANVKNFAFPDMYETSNGTVAGLPLGYTNAWRLASLITRVNYDYASKYYLGASYRLDGSSRLSSDVRWGNFWSVSGAWRISQEGFMKPLAHVLTDLRLRASYGVNGTLPTDLYGYFPLASMYSYIGSSAMRLTQRENKDLKWETNYNLNVGLDFGLWNRINGTVEVYRRSTKDMLMKKPISMTTGDDEFLCNVGELRNVGIEVDINARIIEAKNLLWTAGLNFGHNKNEVVTLDGLQSEIPDGSQVHKIGLPYYTFNVIEFAGINPQTGVPQFYKNTLNPDGTRDRSITEDNKQAVSIPYKSADPKLTGGLISALTYRWFDLGLTFTYSLGGYSYDTWAQKTEHGGSDMKANVPVYYANSWQQPGDVTDIEQFVANRSLTMASITNSRRIHSTDFFRLKNLTFGFSLPKQWVSKMGINKARVYMAGTNLLTWAKWDNYDPECVSPDGMTGWGQPPLRTWAFGIDINF